MRVGSSGVGVAAPKLLGQRLSRCLRSGCSFGGHNAGSAETKLREEKVAEFVEEEEEGHRRCSRRRRCRRRRRGRSRGVVQEGGGGSGCGRGLF
jgi:hypothetical protein